MAISVSPWERVADLVLPQGGDWADKRRAAMESGRRLVFDSETTGFNAAKDRIIELAAVEIVDGEITGEKLHYRLDPEIAIPQAATKIHGITDEQVKGKPLFSEIAGDFIQFVRGAVVVAHNALFDVRFLDAELSRAGQGKILDYCYVLDSLSIARRLWPSKKNNLDAVCDRCGVDRAHRVKHGALTDARLLADAYLKMARRVELPDGSKIVYSGSRSFEIVINKPGTNLKKGAWSKYGVARGREHKPGGGVV